MHHTESIQHAMFLDNRNKALFEQAQEYGFKYLEEAASRNVYPTEEAIAQLAFFEEPLPESPTAAVEVLDTLQRYGGPATVCQASGRYFGFVTGGMVPAGLAAKTLAAYWDQNSAMYVLSPVAATLEHVVEQWLKELFHFPTDAVAGFVSGSSAANLCGLAAARYRQLQKLNWDVNEKGLFGAPRLRIVAGNQAHSTILKAVALLGLGKDQIEWVDTDAQGRIIPEQVPLLDASTILILQAGNVNSGSYDDFHTLCAQAKAANAWVHIDGAFGLWAAVVPQLNHLTLGIEGGDSWALDGHKTLNTPYDSGIVMCADKEALTHALHMSGSYIVKSDHRDGMYYTPEMSRTSRGIELWATLKYLGKTGLQEMILGMHQRACQFADEISRIEGFTVLNDVVFNQVLVQCATDALTTQTMQRVQEQRACWVGGSVWNNRKVIRVSICSWVTTAADITTSVQSFAQALHA